ncbi:hypothetical protein ACLKA6_002676 [Drosophila palustris]
MRRNLNTDRERNPAERHLSKLQQQLRVEQQQLQIQGAQQSTITEKIKEILGLKRVDNESASQLRQFSAKVNSHMRALKTLGNSEQISGCLIVQTLFPKLDVKTQKKWDDAGSSGNVPTSNEFF